MESLLLTLSAPEVAALKRNINDNELASGHLTTTPSSVRHYIDAALAFHLLVQQGAMYNVTVRGSFLLDAIQPECERPYPLAQATKVFFLHTLLGYDYYGMIALVRSLLNGASRMSDIQREHQSQLLGLLEGASRKTQNSRLQRSLTDRLISVRNWKKPESYSEHLVSAKLNWLADLGILASPPASTSRVSLLDAHLDWLEDWASAAEPTEAHLLSLLLRYAQLTHNNVQVHQDDEFCSALQEAFQRLEQPGGLAKIRVSDFILFLACFYPHSLIAQAASGKVFFSKSALKCGDLVYRAHSASRSTQSYIVRQAMGGC